MNITKINVNGEEYYIQDTISGYTSFEWNPTITSGDVVGTMEFNGATYTVYAPVQSMSNALDIEVNGTDLQINHVGSDLTEIVLVDTQQITIPNWDYDVNDDFGTIGLTVNPDIDAMIDSDEQALNFLRSIKKLVTVINGNEEEFIPDDWDASMLVPDVHWGTSIMGFYFYYNSYTDVVYISNDEWESSSQGNTYTVQIKAYI